MTLITTTYCDVDDLIRKVGRDAVREWSDHDTDGIADGGGMADSDVIDDAINQATVEIDGYAQQWYSAAGMAASTLVNRWATVLACYFLSINRGNPPPDALAQEFERIMALLERVLAGTYKLPGVGMRSDMRPSMSNLTVDRRYIKSKLRVEKIISSEGSTTLRQNLSTDIPAVNL